jgi:hypothetical protein
MLVIPAERIENLICFVRDQKVMLDRDIAELYGVETRTLKQAVRRNIERFPPDFMFELTKEEFEHWRSQIVISNSDRGFMHRTTRSFFRKTYRHDRTLFVVALRSPFLSCTLPICT